MSGNSNIQRNMQMQDVEGYVHDVSTIKTPKSGNRYFDFTIQEHVNSTRVVCFCPEKRELVKEKETAKCPVQILSVSPQKRKYQPDTLEYKMGSKSRVVTIKNVPFPWAEGTGKNPKEVSITDVISCNSVGDLVSLKAKVFNKGANETVYSHTMRKTLNMCNLVLADVTGAIRATIWEDMIDKVSDGASYEFKNFKINFFNSKYLNGTPDTEITESKVVEVPPEIVTAAEELIPKAKATKEVDGRIIGADVAISLICISCKGKNVESDDTDKFVECLSCKTSMLKEFLKPTVSANLIIIDENGQNVGRFHCSGAVLNAMFESIKGTENYNIEETDASKLSRKLITETLLLVKKASFKLIMAENVIASMQVAT